MEGKDDDENEKFSASQNCETNPKNPKKPPGGRLPADSPPHFDKNKNCETNPSAKTANVSFAAVQTPQFEVGLSTQQWVNEPLDRLIWMLEQRLGAPVDNATGLTGKYDMTLRWIQDGGRVTDEIHGPPLSQALQEQLGLRVQKKQTAADVLVIDHMEKKPTEN